MTFSQLLDVASVHCMWHFRPCGCSSMWSPPVCSICYHTRLPRPAVQFVLAPFPRWQIRENAAAAARPFSHVWPLIRTACVYMRGLLACLFVCLFACLLVCVKGISGRNPVIERMAQLWGTLVVILPLIRVSLYLICNRARWHGPYTIYLFLLSFHWYNNKLENFQVSGQYIIKIV